jgi:hypothetical protein
MGLSPARRSVVDTAAGIVVAAEAAAFLVASLSHAGVRVPLGIGVVAEPVIVPATVVEGLIAAGFAVAAWAAFRGRPWRWAALVGAHGLSAGGVLLGMVALAVLWTPRAWAVLGRVDRAGRSGLAGDTKG